MRERCPRCGNTDVVVKKFTLPKGKDGNVTVYDYFCPKCGLLETINADEPGWQEAIDRWQQQAIASPTAMEAYWFADANGFHSTVNTVSGKQRWRLTVNASEPRYTLFVDDNEKQRIRTDEWPQSWRMANGSPSPHEHRR